MHLLDAVIGPDKAALTWWQETDRAVIVFVLGLLLLRLSGTRTFSRFSPLDTVVTIIIGSNLSRALTGNAAFLPTLAASAALALLHRLLAQAALHSAVFGRLVKGAAKPLVVDGVLQERALRSTAITRRDLEEAARLHGLAGLEGIEQATLERNGSISLTRRTPATPPPPPPPPGGTPPNP